MPLRPTRNRFSNRSSQVAQFIETVICPEVRRIGLRHARHVRIQHLARLQDADLLQLARRKLLQLVVRHRPQRVRLVAEIFEPDPYLGRVGHHVRAPVIEDLQPSQHHIRLLDVDPGVRSSPPSGSFTSSLFASTPTVMKSRYCRPSLTSRTFAGTFAPPTSSAAPVPSSASSRRSSRHQSVSRSPWAFTVSTATTRFALDTTRSTRRPM